jgi:hypothetical protein
VTETIAADVAVSTSTHYGDKPLPRRNSVKSLLPGSWIKRSDRLEYAAAGEIRQTSGQLLDVYPAVAVLSIRGERTVFSWDVLVLVALVGD